MQCYTLGILTFLILQTIEYFIPFIQREFCLLRNKISTFRRFIKNIMYTTLPVVDAMLLVLLLLMQRDWIAFCCCFTFVISLFFSLKNRNNEKLSSV